MTVKNLGIVHACQPKRPAFLYLVSRTLMIYTSPNVDKKAQQNDPLFKFSAHNEPILSFTI